MLTLNIKTGEVRRVKLVEEDTATEWTVTVGGGFPGIMQLHAECAAQVRGHLLTGKWELDEDHPSRAVWVRGEVVKA